MNKYLAILSGKMPELKKKYPIASLALFGSVVRDDFDEKKSDIDVMVDFQSDDVLLFIQLADELETITSKKVDVVTKRSLKPRQLAYLENQFVYVG